MRIASASDFHIWRESPVEPTRRFVGTVQAERFDIVVLNGDIFDRWKSTWLEIAMTEAYTELLGLATRRASCGLRTVIIPPNHGYGMPKGFLPHVEVCDRYQVGRWLFMHGWEFDVQWRLGALGVSGFAFWLAREHPELMIPLYRLLYGGPKALSQTKHTAREDWSYGVEMVHARARRYAQMHDVNLVIGHTHCPAPFDGLLADDGDFEDSFTYAVIETGIEGRADTCEVRRL